MAEEQQSVASSSRPGSPLPELPNLPSTSRHGQQIYRFNFESTSRRKGPASIAETVDSRADFTAPRTNYAQKYAIPTTGDAGIPSHWSAATAGFNGLSLLDAYIPDTL